MAASIAHLDPDASSFEPRISQATQQPRTDSTAQNGNGQNEGSKDPAISAATLAVFRTENAMIINEVLSTPMQRQNAEAQRHRRFLDGIKYTVDITGTFALALLHASAWRSNGETTEAVWAVTWAYFAVLAAYSAKSAHSLYTHKAAIYFVYLVVALINLRSVYLSHVSRSSRLLATLELVADVVLLIPTLFFPLESKVPASIAAIHGTMRARTQFGDASTAIPSPVRSPQLEQETAVEGDGEQAPLLQSSQAFEEKSPDEKLIAPPEVSASLYGRLSFGFVTPALFKHYKEQFTLPAVPDLPPRDKAATVVAAFRAQSSRSSETKKSDGSVEAAGLIPSSKPLAWRLLRHFWPLLTLQFFWAFWESVLELSPAVGLRLILEYISERDAERNGQGTAQTPWHMAVLFVIFMGLGQCLAAIAASQCLFIGRRICIRLRAILITEIISKALRRSDLGGAVKKEDNEDENNANKPPGDNEDAEDKAPSDGHRASDGEVTNLVSVDVFKVSEICAYLHFLFPAAPVSIVFDLYLLWNLLGWSALVGFAFLVVFLPAQILVARLFVKIQKGLLEATDKRLNLTTEVLNCVKTVKFFAWEDAFAERLGQTRRRELSWLRKRSFAWLSSAFFFIGTPVLVTVATFVVHTQVFHKPLDSPTAFTALALFNLLRSPMDTLPDMIVQVLSSLVSVRRIDAFLREPETTKYEQLLASGNDFVAHSTDDPVIGFKDASFAFKMEQAEGTVAQFALEDLNLSFPPGQLSLVAGATGAGKTCLLMSLLGETHRLKGQTFMPCPIARALEPIDAATGLSDTVAYVSQSAWLLGTTVRENILFGTAYDERRYKQVIKACSLEPDLKILEYHDLTEVGEKGTSLSGGQKARVALARALYSPARLILIDDALSAVDAHTAEHLYHEYLLGDLMKGRTCILVTHAVALCLPGAAYAVHIDNGKVTAAGPASELAAQGVFDHETVPKTSQKTQENGNRGTDEATKPADPSPTIETIDDEQKRAHEEAEIRSKQERKKLSDLDESYGEGAVGLKQYALYMSSFYRSRAAVILYWATAVAVFLISRFSDVGVSQSLRKLAASYSSAGGGTEADGPGAAFATSTNARPLSDVQTWSRQMLSVITPGTVEPSNATSVYGSESQQFVLAGNQTSDDRTLHYLRIYVLWSAFYILVSIFRDGVVLFGALRASYNLYERMTKAILQGRPQFFDRTPVGRIMNRFSKDLEAVDQEIAPTFLFLIDVILQGAVILGVASYALPPMLLFSVFIVLVYAAIGALYIVSSRDLKRIESVQRSPIFTLVGEVLGGAVAIRAYGDAARFTRHCLRLIDKASRPFFFLWYENRWLSMRVDTFAGIVSFIVGLGLIWKPDVDAALAGFTLSFTIQLVDAALWTVRMITQNEINFNSVERIGEYLEIPAERSIGTEPPAGWPSSSGGIVVEDLSVRYSPEFEPVLKGVSFEVKPGEKVGIVGRTGSGKSTLALCFFRFLEAEGGSIVIDGLPISNVPLKTLRQRLTVIPQDAQLFSGTVRSNLDPFSQYEDGELWQALQRVKLVSSGTPAPSRAPSRAPTRPSSPSAEEGREMPSLFTSLDAVIEQGGRNLSSGQRQLLALARGLLKMRDSRILILDESTANLDTSSDRQIQRTIRTEMAEDATIMVIAHRLRTIIDFDKILVLDRGNVLEFDSPLALLDNAGSSFRELCERSGEMELLREMAEKAAAAAKQKKGK